MVNGESTNSLSNVIQLKYYYPRRRLLIRPYVPYMVQKLRFGQPWPLGFYQLLTAETLAASISNLYGSKIPSFGLTFMLIIVICLAKPPQTYEGLMIISYIGLVQNITSRLIFKVLHPHICTSAHLHIHPSALIFNFPFSITRRCSFQRQQKCILQCYIFQIIKPSGCAAVAGRHICMQQYDVIVRLQFAQLSHPFSRFEVLYL